MTAYRRTTQAAFAAVGLLAEVYDGGRTRLSVSEIAERRNLQRPFLAKVLTTLAQAGLVESTRGPGGGFTLTRPPAELTLHHVHRLFEGEPGRDACPFGGGICGVGEACPLHDRFAEVRERLDRIIRETTFEAFRKRREERST